MESLEPEDGHLPSPAARPRRHPLLPAAAFLVAVVVLLGPALTGARVVLPHDLLLAQPPWRSAGEAVQTTNVELRDTIDTYFPVQRELLGALRAGERTDWLPDLFLGVPGLSFLGWGALSPFQLPALVLPFDLAWNWGMALRLLAAMAGAYLLTRSFGAGPVGATVAGLSFGLSGYMVGWLGWPQSHVGALAPWVLWSTRGVFHEAARWWAVLALAVATAALWLGGFPSVAVWVLLAAAAIAVERAVASAASSWRHAALRLLAAAGGVALGTGLVAFTLLPTAAMSTELDLGYRDSMWMARVPTHALLTFLVPKLFGDVVHQPPWLGAAYVETIGYAGLFTLALAGLAAAIRPRAARLGVPAVLAVLFAAVAYGLPPLPRLLSVAPVLSEHPPTRALLLVGLFLAVLGGLGADALVDVVTGRRRVDWWRLAALVGVAVVLGLVALAAARDGLPDARPDGVTAFARRQALSAMGLMTVGAAATGVAAIQARRRAAPMIVGATLVLLVACDLSLFAAGWNVQSPRAGLFPSPTAIDRLAETSQAHRVAGADGVGLPNTHLVQEYRDLRARGFLTPRQRDMLSRVGIDRRSPTHWDLTTANSGRWQPWLSLLGVRAVLAAGDADALGAAIVQPDRGVVVGPLVDGSLVTSEGRVPRDGGVDGVRVRVGTYGRRNEGALVLTLEAPSGRRTARLSTAGLRDLEWVSVAFPSVPVRRDEQVRLSVAGQGDPSGGVALFGNDRDDVVRPAFALRYEEGSLRAAALSGEPELTWIDNPAAWPLVSAVTDVRVVEAGGALDALEHVPVGGPPVAVVETPLPWGIPPDGTAAVEHWRREAGRVSATVRSSDGALVVALEHAARGWRATVNGRPAPLLVANHLFLATPVEAGEHEVVFVYETPGLAAGRAVSLVSLAGLAVWAVASRMRERRGSRNGHR